MMISRRIGALAAGLSLWLVAAVAVAKTKVAAVGASTTLGSGLTAGHHFPDELARLLGPEHDVKNFGVSAAGVLRKAKVSYWNTKEFTDATAMAPDLVILWLGGSDTKPENWEANKDAFLPDYLAMIRHFQNLPSHPRVVTMLSVANKDASGVRKALVEGPVQMWQRQASAETGCSLVDLQAAVGGRAEYFPDGIHPNDAGTLAIAKAAYAVIIAGAPGGDAGAPAADASSADAGGTGGGAGGASADAGTGGGSGAAGGGGATGGSGSGGAGGAAGTGQTPATTTPETSGGATGRGSGGKAGSGGSGGASGAAGAGAAPASGSAGNQSGGCAIAPASAGSDARGGVPAGLMLTLGFLLLVRRGRSRR